MVSFSKNVLTLAALAAFGLAAGAGLTAQASDRMTITVTNYQMAPTDPNGELLKFLGDKFKANFKVINIDGQDSQKYHELLNIKLASGEIPDFMYLFDASTLGNYVKQGVISPITEAQFRKGAPRLAKVLDTYAPGYLNMGKVNGKLYGIPVVSPTNIFHIPLVYRLDWMKKVGVTKTPETLAEFEALMYKFANTPNLNGDGKKTYGLSRDGLTAVFGAFGLVPFDDSDYWVLEDGKIINSSVSPAAKQALALMAKWYKDGVLDPEFITGENQGGYWALSHSFIKGRIGFSSHANYYHWLPAGAYQQFDAATGSKVPNDPGANAKEIKAANPSAEWVFGQPFKGPTGKQGIKSWNRLMNFIAIGKLAEKTPGKIDKILQILDTSASDNLAERLSLKYGFEGTHWKLLDPTTETWVPVPPFDKDTSYWSRIGGELSIETPVTPKADREQWAFNNNFNKNGIESLIQVGLPMALKYDSELKKIRDSAYISIIAGSKPISAFDDFVKAWKAAGGDKVQAEAEAYYKAN